MNLEFLTINSVSDLRHTLKIDVHPKDPIPKSDFSKGLAGLSKIGKFMKKSNRAKLASIAEDFIKEVETAGYSVSGKDIHEAAKALLILAALQGTDQIYNNNYPFFKVNEAKKDVHLDKSGIKDMLTDWIEEVTGMDVGFLLDQFN